MALADHPWDSKARDEPRSKNKHIAIERNTAEALVCACTTGDLIAAQLLVARGASLQCQDYWGRTPLHHASMKGQLKMVQWLLRQKVNVDSLAMRSMTPLHYACLHGHLEVARQLVEKGASVRRKMDIGYNALHYACMHGQLPIVRWLVAEIGADIRDTDNAGCNSFHIACSAGHVEVVRYLVEKDAELQAYGQQGSRNTIVLPPERGLLESRGHQNKLPLDIATSQHRSDVVHYLRHVQGFCSLLPPYLDLARKMDDTSEVKTVAGLVPTLMHQLSNEHGDLGPALGFVYLRRAVPALSLLNRKKRKLPW